MNKCKIGPSETDLSFSLFMLYAEHQNEDHNKLVTEYMF